MTTTSKAPPPANRRQNSGAQWEMVVGPSPTVPLRVVHISSSMIVVEHKVEAQMSTQANAR